MPSADTVTIRFTVSCIALSIVRSVGHTLIGSHTSPSPIPINISSDIETQDMDELNYWCDLQWEAIGTGGVSISSDRFVWNGRWGWWATQRLIYCFLLVYYGLCIMYFLLCVVYLFTFILNYLCRDIFMGRQQRYTPLPRSLIWLGGGDKGVPKAFRTCRSSAAAIEESWRLRQSWSFQACFVVLLRNQSVSSEGAHCAGPKFVL